MKYIPSPEDYKEFFERIPGNYVRTYRSVQKKKDIYIGIPSREQNENIPQLTSLDLNLALIEEILSPAYDIGQIRTLLEMKANPNLNLASGDKLAKKAIIYGQTDIIKLLLAHGLDLDTPITGRISQQNAVQLAKQWKRIEISELIMQHIATQKANPSLLPQGKTDSSDNSFSEHADLDLHNVIPAEENSLDSH